MLAPRLLFSLCDMLNRVLAPRLLLVVPHFANYGRTGNSLTRSWTAGVVPVPGVSRTPRQQTQRKTALRMPSPTMHRAHGKNEQVEVLSELFLCTDLCTESKRSPHSGRPYFCDAARQLRSLASGLPSFALCRRRPLTLSCVCVCVCARVCVLSC